jgi:hypothetical protein
MLVSGGASGVSETHLTPDYQARPDRAFRTLHGVDPELQASIHAVLQVMESEHDIVVHTAFVGGGRLLGLWDASSDWDIYGVFAVRQRERRALARACKFPGDIPDTLRTRCTLTSAIIEVRLWDISKFAQLRSANNGDAITWLRAPGVLVSRGDEGPQRLGDWRGELLHELCSLPCPPGGLQGFSRALTAIYQRAYGNLLTQLDLATPCSCLESQSATVDTASAAADLVARPCSCGSAAIPHGGAVRGRRRAASFTAGVALTVLHSWRGLDRHSARRGVVSSNLRQPS